MMGKRHGGMWTYERIWAYYKFTKDDETIVRFTDKSGVKWHERKGYACEPLKPKRYDDETFKGTVREALQKADKPLGTTELWLECLNHELLLSRKTFLKRLNGIDDEWLGLSSIGSSYVWSVKE